MPDAKDVDVTVRAAEAADAEALAELMIQLGYEHRRYPVQGRAMLLGNGFECLKRAEVWGRKDHRGPMRDASQVSQHHAETMIKRDGNAKPIAMGQAHALADPVTVVEDVVVREHRAFGEARRAGGVLDVDDVVEIE